MKSKSVWLAAGKPTSREADLDLVVPDVDEQVEHPALALGVHRVDERLVAITQVDAAPLRRSSDDLARPGAVGQVDRGEWGVGSTSPCQSLGFAPVR
jgi:hypothetical protein